MTNRQAGVDFQGELEGHQSFSFLKTSEQQQLVEIVEAVPQV